MAHLITAVDARTCSDGLSEEEAIRNLVSYETLEFILDIESRLIG